MWICSFGKRNEILTTKFEFEMDFYIETLGVVQENRQFIRKKNRIGQHWCNISIPKTHTPFPPIFINCVNLQERMKLLKHPIQNFLCARTLDQKALNLFGTLSAIEKYDKLQKGSFLDSPRVKSISCFETWKHDTKSQVGMA